MGKKITNPIEVKATIHFDEGAATYHIDEVSMHCGLRCEHGGLGRAGMDLEQNQEILSIVNDLTEEAVRQKESKEKITAKNSLLSADQTAALAAPQKEESVQSD